jgi:hypothetical protein
MLKILDKDKELSFSKPGEPLYLGIKARKKYENKPNDLHPGQS